MFTCVCAYLHISLHVYLCVWWVCLYMCLPACLCAYLNVYLQHVCLGVVQVPVWKGGTGEGRTLTNALHVPDARLTGTVSEEYATYGPHYRTIHAGTPASNP